MPKDDIINGTFYKIDKKIKKKIKAKYHKINDWVMDPKGYFLIKIDRNNSLFTPLCEYEDSTTINLCTSS